MSIATRSAIALLLALPVTALSISHANASSLDDALRAALANSLTLEASRNDWVAARENIGGAVSTSEWRASGSLSGTQSKTNAETATRDGFLDSQKGSATVTLSKNLFDGGQTKENTKLRTIQLDIALARYHAAEQQVMLATVEAYINVLRAAEEVALNERNVARLKEHVEAARVRRDAGAATQTQLAQAAARLSRAQSTLIAATTALQNAEDTFVTITGMPADGLDDEIIAADAPATLLEADDLARTDHPDARLAGLLVAAAGQEFQALLASLRPTLALSLKASESMGEGRQSDKTELSANLTFSAPLLPSLSVRAKARSMSAGLEATRLEESDALRRVSLNVRNSYRSLENASAQLSAVLAELEASRLVAEGISNEFQFGQKTSLDVLDAEQDVNDAELRRVSAEHAILLAAFRLQAAMGQMTSAALGMEDVLGPIDEMQPRALIYKSYFPLTVEFADDEDAGTDNASDNVDQSSSTAIIQPEVEITPEPASEIVPTIVAVSTIQPLQPVDGINWDIQTDIQQ